MTITSASILKRLLLLFLVFAGLHYGKYFLMPFTIGAVMATLFLPFCKWMEIKGVPKVLAVFSCILVLLLAIGGVVSLLGWQISELIKDITLIKQQIIESSNRMQQYIFNNYGISEFKQMQMLKNEQPSLTGIIQTMAGSLAQLYVNFILVLAYIFLLLYYRSHIKNFFLKLSPQAQQMEMDQVVSNVARVSQQYLAGLSKMIVCLWIMYSIGFSALGVKNALFFAFLCGLLEIIPFVGNITGTILTVLVAATHGGSAPMLGGIIAIYATVQFIQGWLLEPIMVGPQVKINPLFTVIALVIGQLVWGIPGIFLAIPLTAMFKIVCDHVESLKPIGFLIGEIDSTNNTKGFMSKIVSLFVK